VLDGVAAADAAVVVAFERTAFAAAPDSSGSQPAPVALQAPAASAAFSRENDDIIVTLAPSASDDGVRVSWSGDCVQGDGLDVPAGQTEVTIAKGTIQKLPDPPDADGQPTPDPCTL
jgi:hypothetical protein